MKEISKAQINHLRRLLGWVRCTYGVFMTPEEIVRVVQENAPYTGEPSDEGKARLLEWHRAAEHVPIYVRQALKQLAPLVKESEGETVDAGRAITPHRPKRLDVKKWKSENL